MKKLLRKLFLYLFKEDFQRMKALERDLEGLIHRQKCATSLAEVRAERIRKLLGEHRCFGRCSSPFRLMGCRVLTGWKDGLY